MSIAGMTGEQCLGPRTPAGVARPERVAGSRERYDGTGEVHRIPEPIGLAPDRLKSRRHTL